MVYREKLERAAYEIARLDMANIDATNEEIKKEIANCSDSTLIIYISENTGDFE